MNILLLSDADWISSTHVRITDKTRCEHIRTLYQATIGDVIKVGQINGLMGSATICAIQENAIELHAISLNQNPPKPLPLTLVLALPRPKMLKRVLQTVATLGVKKIYLINSYRVEKSFWQTPWLSEKAIHQQFILGLEQARDTLLPDIIIAKRFKPFVEDILPAVLNNTRALVAHPYTDIPCPIDIQAKTTLVVGPEGGFIPYEIDLLTQAGCMPVHLGERIMRVETAIPYLLGRLFC